MSQAPKRQPQGHEIIGISGHFHWASNQVDSGRIYIILLVANEMGGFGVIHGQVGVQGYSGSTDLEDVT